MITTIKRMTNPRPRDLRLKELSSHSSPLELIKDQVFVLLIFLGTKALLCLYCLSKIIHAKLYP